MKSIFLLRKIPLACCCSLLGFGLYGCKTIKEQETASQKPNIIFIMADDLGIGDIGVYGQKIIKTPHIDQLAAEGMKFTNFYAGSTVCAPSRAALLTGQHTGHTEVRGNGEFPLAPDKKIIPELLKENGYTTAMFGKWGLGLKGTTGSPEKRGWDRFLGHLHHVDAHFQKPDSLDAIIEDEIKKIATPKDSFANDLFTNAAVDFIQNQNRNAPFFLYLSFTVPHAELVVPDRYFEKQLNENGESKHAPEEPQPTGGHYGEQKYPKAAYAALVESVDDYVGKVMQTLKEKGMTKNTLVIFTSDNGTHIEGGRRMEDVEYFKSSGIYRGIKRDLYTGGIKEPFIVRWPSQVKAGTTTSLTAAFWDVFPTFANIIDAGIEEKNIDGISFLPTLKSSEGQIKHDYLYWEFHEFGGKQAIIKGKWKALRLDINKAGKTRLELYNIKNDPEEKVNLAEKYPGKIEKLVDLMKKIRTSNRNFNFLDN